MAKSKDIKDKGRSMVEMLGVLAIIGVLSIGGLLGYRYAMEKYSINEAVDAINKFAVAVMAKGVALGENYEAVYSDMMDEPIQRRGGVFFNPRTQLYATYAYPHYVTVDVYDLGTYENCVKLMQAVEDSGFMVISFCDETPANGFAVHIVE